jgi:epoxyqueuosine reductase
MSFLSKIALSNTIRLKANELGFFRCGIAKATLPENEAVRLKEWLTAGRHGEMGYMLNHFEKRTDPRKLFDNAQSVIVVLLNYFPAATIPGKGNYQISKYAYGTDYHVVLKDKLKELIAFIQTQAPGSNARAFVDSAPVLERSWAQRAGLGWIGKNTCLITKEQGSFFFIGEIITDLELAYDDHQVPNHCGGCTRCLEACPTSALDKDGLDSRKCISYWTIEYRGEKFPDELKSNFENWIFGCDICQDVCPWNRLSVAHKEPAFNPPEELIRMRKPGWRSLTQDHFNSIFRKSPVKRARFKGLKRNILFLEKL